MRARPEEIEVVVVAAELEEGLQVALLPARPPAAHPHLERAIGQQVLRARREPEIRLGPLAQPQVGGEDAKRLLVDLGALRFAVAAAAIGRLEHARGRLVAEVGPVLGGDDRGPDLAVRLPDRAGEPQDRGLRPAGPRRAHEPEPRHRHPGDDVRGARVGRRREGDPEVLRQPQGRRVEHGAGLADRDAIQLPGAPRVRDAVPHEAGAGREIHDVAEDVLVRAGEIEAGVAVQVLGVEHAVAVGAARAQVAPGKERHRVAERPDAEGQLLDRPEARFLDRGRPVAQNADVVGRGVEDADIGALGVELALAHVLAAGEERVGSAHGEGVGRDRERVLADRAQVEHQSRARQADRIARRMEHPELEEVVVG